MDMDIYILYSENYVLNILLQLLSNFLQVQCSIINDEILYNCNFKICAVSKIGRLSFYLHCLMVR